METVNERDWLSQIRSELYTAVLSDVLDAQGFRHQALGVGFAPMTSAKRMVGRAFPVLVGESFTMPERPYERLIESLDAVHENDVFITNALSSRAAFWGELLSNACLARKGAGALVDGWVRDVERIEPLGFPVFARGTLPIDSLGRFEVLAYRVPVDCGGVHVEPGDLVMADSDGAVVVPQAVEKAIVDAALSKVRGENTVREGIRQGKTLRSLFDTYGVL